MKEKLFTRKGVKFALGLALLNIVLTCIVTLAVMWDVHLAGVMTIPTIIGLAIVASLTHIAGVVLLLVLLAAITYLTGLAYKKIKKKNTIIQ